MLIAHYADDVVAWAPAKVNLYLEVLSKRADGYHELETLMVAVSLYDTLVFKEDPTGDLRLRCHRPELSTGPDNLVLRAAAGRTLTFGNPYGRAWTPMLEVLGKWEDVSGYETEWDLVPQFQVTLNTRQHIMAATGFRVPITQRSSRDVEFVFYLLWDWFDGGVRQGW